MNKDKKLEIITNGCEEVLILEDLKSLLDAGVRLRHYIGFEISGLVHLGTGLMSMYKVKDFQDAGVECSVLLADWHTWINDKLGGDREKIKKVAVGYFKEAMKASLKCVGGDVKKLKFVLGSDLYHNNDKYWECFVDVSKHVSFGRIQRSITIMGRKEGGNVDFAKLLYPPMQVADIFIQGVNLTHSGMDQRKAHVVARDVALKLNVNPLVVKGNKTKPIAVHHPLILGLGKPPFWPIPKGKMQEVWSALKMSKSKPNTCIFIHDEPAEIRKKINHAFCPEKEIEFNPILDWARHLIFRKKDVKLEIKRPNKFGGDVSYFDYESLKKDYADGKLHPMDLKKGVAEALVFLLEPARKHFKTEKVAKMKRELEKLIEK